MPLFDFERDPGQQMTTMFYPTEYANWRRRLAQADPLAFPAICAHIDSRFSEQALARKPLVTMSWEPGRDWTGTVYEPIYPACNYSEEQAAKFLGLIFMDVAMNRPERWGFGHYDLRHADGTLLSIKGRTYFLLGNR